MDGYLCRSHVFAADIFCAAAFLCQYGHSEVPGHDGLGAGCLRRSKGTQAGYLYRFFSYHV